MSDAFSRLSSAVQYQIVNGLGFKDLRPVQLNAIDPILDGENCVVLAPTAGGKTEAAFFPLLSQMDTHDWRPVSVIYLAPIVALLNNQEHRIQRYAGLVGRRAFKWHGDVGPSARKRFIADPSDILLTTPESLEAMLMSARVPTRRLFEGLQSVVVDEIHAFVGDDRGGHLSAVLERLSRFCGRDVQRIGLSATVGNPEDILSWVKGSSGRQGRVLWPSAGSKAAEIKLDYIGNLENAAAVIASLHAGQKRLVFADSRRRVESLGTLLRERGVDAHVTHSSLSKEQRSLAERTFEEGSNCVIVATSALELGIDVGDLDRVIQIDSPATVASFLQRMGRTGRRANTNPNCLFLATSDDALLLSAALLRLHARSYVEPIPLRTKAAHLLAHQLMALSIQEQGIPRAAFWAWISAATPFSGLREAERDELVTHMLAEGILHEDGGRLSLGERGQKLYGRKNFAELYTVFSAPRTLTVMYGPDAVGQIDANFAQNTDFEKLTFTLGARAWRAKHIDWNRALLYVEPIDAGGLPRWHGQPVLLSRALCQSAREVLTDEDQPDVWSIRARKQMAQIRAEYAFLDRDSQTTLVRDGNGYRLWTFAGGRANNLLCRALAEKLGEKVTASNFSIGFKEHAGESEVAIRHAIAELRESGRPNRDDAIRLAGLCARGRLSKFEPCLPDVLLNSYLADELTESNAAGGGAGADADP
jgi:ATP-dependent helicase Lhr and Lhr-like helicase